MSGRPNPVATDDGREVRVLEELTSSAPLAVRFWDVVTDAVVGDGLAVTARPSTGGATALAQASPSGVHVFHTLATTRAAERGPVGNFGTTVAYDIHVVDGGRRFVPMVLSVPAPTAPVQPAGDGVAGYPLFSAATRSTPPGWLAVRADLANVEAPIVGQQDAFQPASHAIVRVSCDGVPWLGVADAEGRVVVLLPAPAPEPPAAEPEPPPELEPEPEPEPEPGPDAQPVVGWPVTVEVCFAALGDRLGPPPHLNDLLAQSPSVAGYPAGAASSFSTTVAPRGDLVLRSPNRSDLLVNPA